MKLAPFAELLGPGDFSEVFLEESSSLALRWEEERLDSVSINEESGAGLRILSGGETRYAHADLARPLTAPSEANLQRLKRLRDDLARGLATSPVTECRGLIMTSHSAQVPAAGVPLERKVDLLRRAEQAAHTGPHLRQVTINYAEKMKRVGCLNSEGGGFIEKRSYVVLSMTVTVERGGDRQTAYDAMGGLLGFELFAGDKVERLAAAVSRRAHQKLDAPNAPAGEMPVVIAASAGGTLIHEAVGHSLEADAVLEGSSPAFQGKIGQVVANEKLTVLDDPTLPGVRGSFHFDDEGTPAQATRLIENGVLRDYLFDRLSARRAGRRSNGHGRRESFAHRPIPRMSNTLVAPGPDDPAAIIASVPDGFLVTKMGGGQVNTANGDFVFEVEEGFLIKDGARRLVRGATLLGNGPEILRLIDMVGSDQGWGIGTCGKEGQGVPVSDALPTVRVKKLVVGGPG